MVEMVIGVVAVLLTAFLCNIQLDRERREWTKERSQLLDRIQAGNFVEFKAQERADVAKTTKKEKNPLDKERYL